MRRALVWVVEQASVACVWIATGGQMRASLCAVSYLMQSPWRHVLDVLCFWHEPDHTKASFGRCFGNASDVPLKSPALGGAWAGVTRRAHGGLHG